MKKTFIIYCLIFMSITILTGCSKSTEGLSTEDAGANILKKQDIGTLDSAEIQGAKKIEEGILKK